MEFPESRLDWLQSLVSKFGAIDSSIIDYQRLLNAHNSACANVLICDLIVTTSVRHGRVQEVIKLLLYPSSVNHRNIVIGEQITVSRATFWQ